MKRALLSRVMVDPEICHGTGCIRELRYPVEMILELLTSGVAWDALEGYEDLKRADVQAVSASATS